MLRDNVEKNELQDPAEERPIRADARLLPVFGGNERSSIYEMTKLMNQNVTPA